MFDERVNVFSMQMGHFTYNIFYTRGIKYIEVVYTSTPDFYSIYTASDLVLQSNTMPDTFIAAYKPDLLRRHSLFLGV
jgi:hypothetical protein